MVAVCVCGVPSSSLMFSREPGRLACLSQLVGLPVMRFVLLGGGEGLSWCFLVPLAWSRISFSSFPIFCFYAEWLTTASLVFSQHLAWLFTVMFGHRGAGELNIASLGRRADWLEDMAFSAC